MKLEFKNLGADPSPYDGRTYKHDIGTLAIPLTKGGHEYIKEDIDHQHNVGICTAISLTQNAGKALGKKFSPDFQYLLQKKYFDPNWLEGSSIFSSLRVGKKFGFLPIELFPYVTENDRNLPYSQYTAKLQAIPDSEIERLIGLCADKLAGYAQLPLDAHSVAKGILDSKSGILCRYEVGKEWWTAKDGRISWLKADIDPLLPPKQIVSGHAIGSNLFDFSVVYNIEHPNTWGTDWNDEGKGHTIHSQYPCTEAWIPYYDTVPTPLPSQFVFTNDMKYGDKSDDVKQLQKRLNVAQSGYYGDMTAQAVLKFQLDKGISLSIYERYILKGRLCGPKTRAKLNS